MYNVQIEQFQGPFELLIELIDRKKLSINQISLAEIADQYLSYLKEINRFPLKEVASFVVVAATLMLIKSRSLMPSLKLSKEEEHEIKDFEARLKLYERFRFISREVEEILGKKIIFAPEESRLNSLQEKGIFVAPKDLSMDNLKNSLLKMLDCFAVKEPLPEKIVKKTITLEEKMNSLIKKLENKINLCFSDLGNNGECKKVDLIVNFLAMLELVRRDFIIAKQNEKFGEIEITKV